MIKNYMIKNYIKDKIPKPRSWYYMGITNMLIATNNDGNVMFSPLEMDKNLGVFNQVTSLSLTKGGKLELSANYTPMLYIQNTIFRMGPNVNFNNLGPKYPVKLILGGMNVSAKRLKEHLVFIVWNSDYYFLTMGKLGEFPNEREKLVSIMYDTLDILFYSNENQRITIQKSLYFNFKSLIKKMKTEKFSKEYTIYYA